MPIPDLKPINDSGHHAYSSTLKSIEFKLRDIEKKKGRTEAKFASLEVLNTLLRFEETLNERKAKK